MSEIIDWPGISGASCRYWFLGSLRAEDIKDEGGNYMFVKRLANGNWLPVYIGQAVTLRGRLPSHEQLADARKAGATHIMAHTQPAGERARLAEERDLIERWLPVLNTQHNQAS